MHCHENGVELLSGPVRVSALTDPSDLAKANMDITLINGCGDLASPES